MNDRKGMTANEEQLITCFFLHIWSGVTWIDGRPLVAVAWWPHTANRNFLILGLIKIYYVQFKVILYSALMTRWPPTGQVRLGEALEMISKLNHIFDSLHITVAVSGLKVSLTGTCAGALHSRMRLDVHSMIRGTLYG
jgi:hypothetical protein